MSNFYENPENLKLLQKAQLKKQNGMDIKNDVIQLMEAAFNSMTDEDFTKYHTNDKYVQLLFERYCPELSPLPLVAIEQLIKAMSQLFVELASKNTMILSESLLIQRMAILIDQYNVSAKIYSPGKQQTSAICQRCLNDQPDSLQQWIKQYQNYCQQYLTDSSPEALAYIAYYYVHGQLFVQK